jgi:hypothetical protein
MSIKDREEKIRNELNSEVSLILNELQIEVRHWEDCFPSSAGSYQGSEYLSRFINAKEIKQKLIDKINELL